MSAKVFVPVLIFLVLTTGAGGGLYYQTNVAKQGLESQVATLQTELTNSETKAADLQTNLTASQTQATGLQGQLKDSETKAADLQTKLTASQTQTTNLQAQLKTSEGQVATLQTSLQNANDSVKTQQNLNTTLTAELKKIKYPRHFASIQELTDWLHKDDTNTKYPNASFAQISFILQVRALADGYLLPAYVTVYEGQTVAFNEAVIGDNLYAVSASQDLTEAAPFRITPVPSYPISAP
ncbi:MAG: hypothetical protein PHR56_01115 [Dehalococcoidales bacterium]|nr:hypothetical protein [Dehalococcoidales bacterium]